MTRPGIVLTDAPVCPGCGTPMARAHKFLRSGEAWMGCRAVFTAPRGDGRGADVGPCGAVWLAKTLTPGTTGADLRDDLGDPALAAALLRARFPWMVALADDECWPHAVVPLDRLGARQWLIIPVPAADAEALRYAPLRAILRAAGVLRAAA